MNSVALGGSTGWTYRPVLARRRQELGFVKSFVGLLLFSILLSTLGGCNGSAKLPLTTAAVPIRPVRVKLLEDIGLLEMSVSGPYVITDAEGEVLRRTSSTEPFKVRQEKGRILINGRSLSRGSVDIRPTSFGTVQVGDQRYRGFMRLTVSRHGSLMLINHVALEDYVASVLGGELPGYFHREAFRAQAVAARTYVLHRMLNTSRTDWDVASTAASQVYSGVKSETAITRKAQGDTHGQVLVFNEDGREEVICTFYSSTCGGGTQPVSAVKKGFRDIPPLAGVSIDLCQDSPHYRWKKRVWDKGELGAALIGANRRLRRLGRIELLKVSKQTEQGRPTEITLVDQRGREEAVPAEDLRQRLSLPSTWFSIEDHGGEVWFTNGRGWGHGIGMCQYGANQMARMGYGYRQILASYYPGSQLLRCY